MRVDNASDRGQADPIARGRIARHAVEQVEDSTERLGGNARTGILHLELHESAAAGKAHSQPATLPPGEVFEGTS